MCRCGGRCARQYRPAAGDATRRAIDHRSWGGCQPPQLCVTVLAMITTEREQRQHMPTSKPRRNRPTAPRLMCSADTVAAVDAVLPRVIGTTGQMVRKTDLVDIIVATGLAHMDEITDGVARLNATADEDGPDGGETA